MSEVQFLAEDIKGTYDHRKCGVCGHPLNAHPDTCQRDRYLPEWTRWLKDNPDPRPKLVRLLRSNGVRYGVECFADVNEWIDEAEKSGVPKWAIEEGVIV